jgi:signal transduction histidine kinase
MADKPYPRDVDHELKNQLAIISGYCDLLLEDTPRDDPRLADLLEIQRAAAAALQLLGQPKRT